MADLSLDGLASGLPTNDTISKILSSEFGTKFENLKTEKSELQQSKDAWRDVNSRLSKLESTLTDLKLSSTFTSMKTTSTDQNIATATATNDASEATYDIDVSQLAKANRVASVKVGDSFGVDLGGTGNTEKFQIELKDASGNNTISGNKMDVTIEHGDSLEDIKNAINNATVDHDGDTSTDEIKIAKASIVDNRLVIESYQTGKSSELAFKDSPSAVLTNDLGFNLDADGNVTGPADGTIDDPSESGVLQNAQNANFTVNGLGITKESNNDIDDVINDLTLNLEDNGSTTIEVIKDIEKASSAIQSFVDQYNSTMSFIDEKSSYNVETDKASILQGDSTLMRLQTSLRSYVTNRVDNNNKYNQLSMVGISIDQEGNMSFDKAKFKEAVEESPDKVKRLFNADSNDGDSFDGVATRLDSYKDALLQTNTGVIPERLDYFDTRMDDIEDEITSLEEDYQQEKARLSSEFTAMETAMSKMNSQSSWLQSQLANLANTSLLGSM